MVEEPSEEESGSYEDESADLMSASAGCVMGMRREDSRLVAHSFSFSQSALQKFFFFFFLRSSEHHQAQ